MRLEFGRRGMWAALYRLSADRDHPIGLFILTFTTFVAVIAFLVFPCLFVMLGKMTLGVLSGNISLFSIDRACFELRDINGARLKIDQCKGTIEPYGGLK